MTLAPLEALGYGRSVAVTGIDGARESLPSALAQDRLVPPEDPAAPAGAVNRLPADPVPRAALGARGRRHVPAPQDARHTAERIAAGYHELLGTRPPVPSERREPIHS